MAGLLDKPPAQATHRRAMLGMYRLYRIGMWVITAALLAVVLGISEAGPDGHVELGWPTAILVSAIAAFVIGGRLRIARANRESHAAVDLLEKGLTEHAATALEAMVVRYRWPRAIQYRAKYFLALAQARLGRHERAVALLKSLMDDQRAQKWQGLALLHLSAMYTLMGQLAEGQRYLEWAERLRNISVYYLVWPRALLMARHGQLDELARELETHWRQLESGVSGLTLRQLTLVRAFAVASVAGPRDAALAEPHLGRLRPVTRGEYDWLTVGWPELAAFVAANL